MGMLGNANRKLTTHVLDTALGIPAKGIEITLYRSVGGKDKAVAQACTNADGRCDGPILEGSDFISGDYMLVFHVADYFSVRTQEAFFKDIPIRFSVGDSIVHYHVPLLLSPFGYSTYRGS